MRWERQARIEVAATKAEARNPQVVVDRPPREVDRASESEEDMHSVPSIAST